jgi:galactose mutarotase-like enzyme
MRCLASRVITFRDSQYRETDPNLRKAAISPHTDVSMAMYPDREMPELCVCTGQSINSLRTIVLENAFLRIVVLPEAGARIWQITYKPFAADLLWNNPALAPSTQALHASYDDNWCGGWDDLFPNDEAGLLAGLQVPDHGELWTGSWDATWREEESFIRLDLRFHTPITHFLAERSLILRSGSCVVELEYRLTNQSPASLPFLWKLHPAFAVSPQHRIDFPPMQVVREMDFAGTLGTAPPIFDWPIAETAAGNLDLRNVPDVSSRALHFFYGTGYTEGWCGVTNRSNQLAAALRFDPQVFSSCWLFATHGGWNDLNVAVLEPATGYPFRIQSMVDSGRARVLAPGETLATAVLFSVQQGLKSIGGVREDGHILPAIPG